MMNATSEIVELHQLTLTMNATPDPPGQAQPQTPASLDLDQPQGEAGLVDIKLEVKEEMGLLTKAITDVHSMDSALFEAKMKYRKEVDEIRRKMYKMYKAHRKSIEKTKPYFLAKDIEEQMLEELEEADEEAEKTKLLFEQAKEEECMAERDLQSAKQQAGALVNDKQCSHMLELENWNRATERVLSTSKQRAEAEDIRRVKEEQYLTSQRAADEIFMDLKEDIQICWPYYAMKEAFEKQLEKMRRDIREQGRNLAAAKQSYKETFSRVNLVATDIEQKKNLTDLKSGVSTTDNFSQFEEVHDIDIVLAALEAKTENMSSCLDNMEEDDDDFFDDLDLQPQISRLFIVDETHSGDTSPRTTPRKSPLREDKSEEENTEETKTGKTEIETKAVIENVDEKLYSKQTAGDGGLNQDNGQISPQKDFPNFTAGDQTMLPV